MSRVLKCFAAIPLLSFAINPILFAQNQSESNQKPGNQNHEGKILVDTLAISGTRAVDSAELAEIAGSMAGSEFDNDTDELGERIRAQFQDRGYFQVEVQKVDMKVLDPLASPKPVRLEAEVREGPLCRLSSLEISGYQAIPADDMRAAFPIKIGDVFARSKIARGLEGLRDLYASHGFMDFIVIPKTEIASNSTVKLTLTMEEGPQYHMGKFEVLALPELVEKLQTQWKLAPGAVYDARYVKAFLETNSSFLPPDFTQSSGVELVRNCPDTTVSVYLNLGQDPQQAVPNHEKSVECSSSHKD